MNLDIFESNDVAKPCPVSYRTINQYGGTAHRPNFSTVSPDTILACGQENSIWIRYVWARNFWIRKEKVADSKIPWYVWTTPKATWSINPVSSLITVSMFALRNRPRILHQKNEWILLSFVASKSCKNNLLRRDVCKFCSWIRKSLSAFRYCSDDDDFRKFHKHVHVMLINILLREVPIQN